jgi:hypothetical protein
MKKLKHVIFIPLFFLAATSLLAETSKGEDSSSVSSNVDKNAADDDDDDELKHVEFGIRYMPTFSSIDMNTSNGVVQGSFTMSNGFGVMLGINLTQNVGVQGEINYYQINQKYADGSLNRDLTINYLNIPVLLSLNTNKAAPVNLNFVAGPQFGINVGSNFETSGSNGSETARAVVALRKGDVGVAYGAGLEFALNKNHSLRLDLGFRGFYGLVNMDSSTNQDGTYNVIVSASRKTYGGYVGLAWMF